MDSSTTSSLETLQDIKRMMERSSRFISLSGLSGVSAGICALVGAYVAHTWIVEYFRHPYEHGERYGYVNDAPKFVVLAAAVLLAALISSFYFTWRKARKNDLPFWDPTTRKLMINLAIPLVTGGFFVMGLVYHMAWGFVAPACLIFYGLALVNASKFTLSDIRWLGIFEIFLGLINIYYEQFSLYFWAAGFGVLHIIYGLMMWWKYDRGVKA
jgi:hypothetical protein